MKTFLATLLAFFILVPSVAAQKPTTSPSPQPQQEISSFDIFWPVAPGKTMDNSLYVLKTFKEKMRGMLIFGKAQKADYELFLSTKRIVEAEKLINEDKKDVALKTLTSAQELLQSSLKNVESAKESGGLGEPAGHISSQVNNIETFMNWYKMKVGDDYKGKVEDVLKADLAIKEKL